MADPATSTTPLTVSSTSSSSGPTVLGTMGVATATNTPQRNTGQDTAGASGRAGTPTRTDQSFVGLRPMMPFVPTIQVSAKMRMPPVNASYWDRPKAIENHWEISTPKAPSSPAGSARSVRSEPPPGQKALPMSARQMLTQRGLTAVLAKQTPLASSYLAKAIAATSSSSQITALPATPFVL